MTTTSENTAIKTVLFFAYGTLRKGERLHDWISDEIVSELGVGEMPMTRLYFSRSHKAFPYLMVTDNPDDKAVGEIYELPLNEQVIAMLQMEVNAGYRIMSLEANIGGESVEVMVCVLDKEHAYVAGQPVPDNNWLSRSRTEWWS